MKKTAKKKNNLKNYRWAVDLPYNKQPAYPERNESFDMDKDIRSNKGYSDWFHSERFDYVLRHIRRSLIDIVWYDTGNIMDALKLITVKIRYET